MRGRPTSLDHQAGSLLPELRVYFLRLPDIRTTFPLDQPSHQSAVHPQGSNPQCYSSTPLSGMAYRRSLSRQPWLGWPAVTILVVTPPHRGLGDCRRSITRICPFRDRRPPRRVITGQAGPVRVAQDVCHAVSPIVGTRCSPDRRRARRHLRGSIGGCWRRQMPLTFGL
jgi:hypothetical protein